MPEEIYLVEELPSDGHGQDHQGQTAAPDTDGSREQMTVARADEEWKLRIGGDWLTPTAGTY